MARASAINKEFCYGYTGKIMKEGKSLQSFYFIISVRYRFYIETLLFIGLLSDIVGHGR